MADLEKLLLQAAGRTVSGRKNNNNSRPQSKWKRDSSYLNGSDSRDEDPDNPNNSKGKHSVSSQAPLKKRFDPLEKGRSGWSGDEDDDEDDRQSGDDSDSASSVGSDLYKDDADKEELGKMSELDREMILAERSTRIDDYKLKKMARASSSKIEKLKGRSPPLPNWGPTAVWNDKAAAKTALNELDPKQMRQQEPANHRSWLRDLAGNGDSGGLNLQDSSTSRNRNHDMATSPPSGNSNEGENGGESYTEDEIFHGDKKMDDDMLEDISPSRLDAPQFEDVKVITISRSKLVKWFMEPFFEELIGGCFVRVGIGKTPSGKSKYKLCLVRNVDATDPEKHYKLDHYSTYKWLNCVWGSEATAARWQMAMVSDSVPLEDEFYALKYEVEKAGGRMPTRLEVLDKKEEIHKINSFVYSAATVKRMLLEKKSASLRPVNIAAEKDRLRKQMEVAHSRRDEARVERIRVRLKELENMSRQKKQVNEKAVRLAEMNRRNRAENFKNASQLKPVNTSLKAGEAGYDPFSRRWTRSRNYYVSTPGGDGSTQHANVDQEKPVVAEGVTNGLASGYGIETDEAATAAALQAAAGAGKLIDTKAPVDQGTASNCGASHKFELPISLVSLQKFGGPHGMHTGLMARKQKIESTMGCKVPDSDERRHSLTLTVSDYKRRRGLL